MRKDDVIGISTMTFTPTGEAFYLSSSSELARVSMAAAYNLQATGKLHIFWEGHKILRNYCYYIGQIYSGDFAKISGLLRICEV